jgi:hypothetical protein
VVGEVPPKTQTEGYTDFSTMTGTEPSVPDHPVVRKANIAETGLRCHGPVIQQTRQHIENGSRLDMILDDSVLCYKGHVKPVMSGP